MSLSSLGNRISAGHMPSSGGIAGRGAQFQRYSTIEQQVDLGPKDLDQFREPRGGVLDPLVQPTMWWSTAEMLGHGYRVSRCPIAALTGSTSGYSGFGRLISRILLARLAALPLEVPRELRSHADFQEPNASDQFTPPGQADLPAPPPTPILLRSVLEMPMSASRGLDQVIDRARRDTPCR